jgi:AcrR family transcriptional regulator
MAEHHLPAPRERILEAAGRLLDAGGRAEVTTRAVSAEAGVQPQTIYRQFGDMKGLLDAVAVRGFERYLALKHDRPAVDDPVDDLRSGWDLHVEFGLANPAIYVLMYGGGCSTSEGLAQQLRRILDEIVAKVGRAGRLAVSQHEAVDVIDAAGVGVTLSLISGASDPRLSTTMREIVLGAVTLGPDTHTMPSPLTHAIALAGAVPTLGLTPGESHLLAEWLHRITR